MKPRRIYFSALHMGGSLAFVIFCLTLSYYLTGILFQRIAWHPPGLALQIINTLLGILLMVLAVLIAGLLFGRRKRNPFTTIIETLERIAKGDFSARLDQREMARGPVVELVQTVNHMAMQLDEMEKMRREFISNVSHEIQSPITSIRGFACALRETGLSPEERRHYIEIIEAEGLRLSKLTTNLLKLSSLEAGQIHFEPEPYRLDTQIRTLILAHEPQWNGKRLTMDAALDEVTIAADEDLLSQVWINLIHNAIKFTPEGGTVRLALRAMAGQIELSVADTGIGIALEDQPHIFDRFYKADKSRTRGEAGSGLGLSIAKKTVEKHGGTIEVRSEPGAGATFVVKLPVSQPAAPRV